MSDSILRKFNRQFRENTHVARVVKMERELIRQKREAAAKQSGREDDIVTLQETPEQKSRRWKAIAAKQLEEVEERIEKALMKEFLVAAERGNTAKIIAGLDEGYSVNYQDPQTEETALHIAAAGGARKVLRALISTGECDFLIRDRRGRLASEMAYLHSNDPVAARFLGVKERKQGEELGIRVTRRI